MNVRELIEILSKYPPNAEVNVSDLSDDHREPVTVYDRTNHPSPSCDHLAVFIDARPEPTEAGELSIDSVLKSKMGHLIDEAVEYVTKRMTASRPFYKATSDHYRERLDDEWQALVVPKALRDVDTDDVWNYFIDIVVALAEGDVNARRAARGAE